jgi:hypothetical protein
MTKLFGLFLFVVSSATVNAEDILRQCEDAQPSGVCSDLVKTGMNVCEANQGDKKLTARTLKDAMATTTGSKNFKKLVALYRKAHLSAKSDAKKQKVCVRVTTALSKDCSKLCGPDVNCSSGKAELDKLSSLCSRNEQAAESVAITAAQDAALFSTPGGFDVPTGGGGGNGPGETEEAQDLGYNAEISNPNGLGGANGGPGGGGATAGSGSNSDLIGSDGSGSNKDLADINQKNPGNGAVGVNNSVANEAAGAKVGTGTTNTNGEGSGSRDLSGSANGTGISGANPGYMLMGPPRSKHKPAKRIN